MGVSAGTSGELVRGMLRPEAYPHAAPSVELAETHISWVFLAGGHAYKVKKPVDLGFLDFSTLARRRACCEEEVRLNRRFAPRLYLDVVPIAGSAAAPRVGGSGPPIEYAVRMLRFEQDALGTRLLERGALDAGLLDRFAGAIAGFHARAAVADAGSPWGAPAAVAAAITGNFTELDSIVRDAGVRRLLAELRSWADRALRDLAPVLEARQAGGRVRECHGDLHLGNVVLHEGELVAFDCIEFSEDLRRTDVISDVAFLAMDLMGRGRADLAWRFLNAYLEAGGDYDGVRVLRLYLAYRALVRAKVHGIRALQAAGETETAARLLSACHRHVELAARLARDAHPVLIAMHGLSGSGKTHVSQAILEAVGAIRLRSDVERKRQHGVHPQESSYSSIKTGIYSDESSRLLYQRLAGLGCGVLGAGYPLILDAAFLQRWQRDIARELAAKGGSPCVIVACDAPEPALRERIAARVRAGRDASDACDAVLTHQIASREALAPDELAESAVVDTRTTDIAHGVRAACERIRAGRPG